MLWEPKKPSRPEGLSIGETAARETLRRALTKNVMEIENSVSFTLEVLTELLADNGSWFEETAKERKERTEAIVRLRGLEQWMKRTDL